MSYTRPSATAANASWESAGAYTRPLASAADATWEAGSGPSITPVSISAVLPGLTLTAAVDSISNVEIVCNLPALSVSVALIPPTTVEVAATLPGLTLSAVVVVGPPVSVSAVLPGLTLSATATYDSRTSRPTVSQAQAKQSAADPLRPKPASIKQQDALPSHAPVVEKITAAQPLTATLRSSVGDADRRAKSHTTGRLSGAARLSNRLTASAQDASRVRRSTTGHAENARPLARTMHAATQDTLRHERSLVVGRTSEAQPLFIKRQSAARTGAPLWRAFAGEWQDAMRPQPGQTPPVIPPVEPCYTPSPHLRFSQPWATDGHLLFVCERVITPPVDPEQPATIIIPTRTVYMQINSQSLAFAASGDPIECRSLQLSIDVDSWCWGWSASVPARYQAQLLSPDSNAIELIATINGTDFRLSVGSVQRSRKFGESTLSISGRSRAEWLSEPRARKTSRGNPDQAQTAQQLMAAALTENGQPLGWSLDWQIDDWLVPAGAWAHHGTPMDACLQIADAAGAYIQAHRTDQTLHILPRYKIAPWAWSTATPDIQLPEAACSVEGIEWIEKPQYNSVYLAGGQQGGIMGSIIRDGTTGEIPAPMQTHPLFTHADAVRQKGTAILADTGRQKSITLTLPVFADTGIIQPGKLIRYTESGEHHLGITRAVTVNSDFPTVRQTLKVESHVL